MHKKNLTAFFLVVIFFAIPIFGAWWLFNHHTSVHLKTINHGTLIQPPLLINTLTGKVDTKNWQDHWVLVYVNPQATCPKTCQQALYFMRQVRAATGKNQDRLLRAYLQVGAGAPLDPAFAGTQVLHVTATQLTQFLSQQEFSKEVLEQGQLFIVDPQGWVMMRYPIDFKAKDLLDDLNRLLMVN